MPEHGRHERLPAVAGPAPAVGVIELLRMPLFRRVMLVSALVLGSHAMHDAFAVIRWSAAGITPAMASVLWSESVGAEVIVFFLIGPPLVKRLGPAGVMALAAIAGVLRWVVMALTTDVMALALVQPFTGSPSRRCILPACASLRRSSRNTWRRRRKRCMRSVPGRPRHC